MTAKKAPTIFIAKRLAATRSGAGSRMLRLKPAATESCKDQALVCAPLSAIAGTFLAYVGAG